MAVESPQRASLSLAGLVTNSPPGCPDFIIGLDQISANPVQMKAQVWSPNVHTKKSTYELVISALELWAHLGSNQGPPDYESGALTG
jgi:hypothetical protein